MLRQLLLSLPLVSAFLASQLPTHSSSWQHSSRTSLFGIRGFRSWFESQFPGAMTTLANDRQHSESFDHVLVDMNQLLHVCVRKSRTEGHALVLLIKELDALVTLATPQISLVLAMDGPPPAAKLATQRSRRYSLLRKAEWRRKNLRKIKYLDEKEVARKQKRTAADAKTLCITPGTEFMERAHQAVMYWAWQRLDSKNSILAKNTVQIYISPSNVHGEGEVKLLAWIYDHQRRHNQESIAIYGGDSDLVLEALTIPTTITHNVFVLLPEGNRKHFAISLWETTRILMAKLPNNNIVHLRTDLVLLLILNGNDYLPKLRGSSGFHKLFQSYVALQKSFPGNLVDPDTLEFNLQFCTAFFNKLAESVPPFLNEIWLRQSTGNQIDADMTVLSQLHNYVASGYLPGPVEFHVKPTANTNVEAEDDTTYFDAVDDDSEMSAATKDDDGDDANVLVQLRIGVAGSTDFCVYETCNYGSGDLKLAKQELASMALDDLFTLDEEITINEEDDELDISDPGYDWEVQGADANIQDYLYGLLWNLQTYQDGICADYAFNYGKKHSPTAADIVKYFKLAVDANETIGISSLKQQPFSPAMSAGVACLAALPSAVKHLVPQPYRLILNETVEAIYASCISRVDNVFDSNRFQNLCDAELAKLSIDAKDTTSSTASNSCWTVLSKSDRPLLSPHVPPLPFSQRLIALRPSNRIRINLVPYLDRPRQRLSWSIYNNSHRKRDVVHSELVPFMSKLESLESVRYKKAYIHTSTTSCHARTVDERKPTTRGAKDWKNRIRNEDNERLKPSIAIKGRHGVHKGSFAKTTLDNAPAIESLQLSDGTTAVACLGQLVDAGLIRNVHWDVPVDSESDAGDIYETLDVRVSTAERQLRVECERKKKAVTRKVAKQYMAAQLLEQMIGVGPDWRLMTFKKLRDKVT